MMAFDRFDTKSPSEAVEVLFSQAVPNLPIVSMEDISRICRNDLNYDVQRGQWHVTGTATHLKQIIAWNLDKAPTQLYSGQRVVGYQVAIQPQLQFAVLTLFIGDASGTPGYAFGARVWSTADELFVQGWEGFQTSPLVSPLSQPAVSSTAPVEASTPSAMDAEPEALIAGLRSKSWEIRAAAAELLGERRNPQTLEALIHLLKDEYLTVQESAAAALRTLGDARGIASVKVWEYSGRPVFLSFGPDDPADKRRKEAAAEAKVKVQQARIELERSLEEGVSPASQGKERPRKRPWWRFWS